MEENSARLIYFIGAVLILMIVIVAVIESETSIVDLFLSFFEQKKVRV